jgi:bacterioferritin-associated ferredoxin
MIVCSCNVFTDHDVRATLSGGEDAPRTTGQVYNCLGCSAQCGRCARTIRRIMNEALGGVEAADQACGADAPMCCRNTAATA